MGWYEYMGNTWEKHNTRSSVLARAKVLQSRFILSLKQPTSYKMAETSTSELACVYSALILHDDDVDITADKIQKICAAANVAVEPFWPGLFAKALEGRNIGDLISNVGSAPAAGGAAAGAAAGGDAPAAAEEKKEEKKEESEESDDDMGFGLFD